MKSRNIKFIEGSLFLILFWAFFFNLLDLLLLQGTGFYIILESRSQELLQGFRDRGRVVNEDSMNQAAILRIEWVEDEMHLHHIDYLHQRSVHRWSGIILK